MGVIRQIQDFNAGRDPERLQLKYSKMRINAFVFMRATCHLFYDRLPPDDIFKQAPLTWACGDLHLENFGSYKGDNRLVYFDLNDFDEAALAPASWDLVRMLTSLWVAADSLSLSRPDARQLCLQFLNAYASSLALGKAFWVERDTAPGLVGALLDGLNTRRRAGFLDSRTQHKGKQRVLLVDGKKALPASDRQHAVVTDFMATFAKTQAEPDFFEVLDVARRIAGTGSLGVDRYVILVQGKGSPDGNYLLDLKQSLASSLTVHLKVAQPRWPTQAHRVVALQQRLQAVSMAFLHPVMLGDKPFVLRGLQPSEDRIALDRTRQSMGELGQAIEVMGRLLAWAQLRSSGREGAVNADALIDFGNDTTWCEQLLSTSQDCAAQVREDAKKFNAAYDDAVFAV